MLEGLVKFLFIISIFLFIRSYNRLGEKIFINLALSSTDLSSKLHHESDDQPVEIPREQKDHRNSVFQVAQAPENKFPANFSIGVSTSAYQIEGGWNADGKSPSTWDTFVHDHPELITDGSNADVGPDSYHHFADDVAAVNLVGFQHYRFSISWTRILPDGSAVNQAGLDWYHRLIDALIASKIEPIVTIFHFDLPQWLQDLGGMANPIFADYLKAYANVLFNAFGHKVKRWITINEPYNYCVLSYGTGIWAPGIKSPGVGDYLCGHHILMGHAAVYHLYKEKYFEKFRGQVGITLDMKYYFPGNSSVSAEEYQRAMKYRLGWFADPIFSKEGGYPSVMTDEIGKRSSIEGRPFSRFPEMSEELKQSLKGSSDFFGINYYTSGFIDINKAERDPLEEPSWSKDSGIITSVDANWKRAKSEWLYSVPEGLRSYLNYIKNEYNNPPIFIAEAGWSDNGEIEDIDRVNYLNSHLLAVSQAINEDNCNVIAFTAWSLIDLFEWNVGFTAKFGLFKVNHTSPNKERTPKNSVSFFQSVIKNRAPLNV